MPRKPTDPLELVFRAFCKLSAEDMAKFMILARTWTREAPAKPAEGQNVVALPLAAAKNVK